MKWRLFYMKKAFTKVISLVLCFALLFGLSATSSAAETGISRISCTVYGDTSSQKGFTWYTPQKTDTKIVIYDEAGQDVTAGLKIEYSCAEWQGNYVHKAIVSGLTAGAAYTYKVGDGAVWSDIGSFTTDDGDDSLNFIVIADVQASSLENFESAAKVVDKAFETMPEAEFFASLGDFTNDSTNAEWDAFSQAFGHITNSTTLAAVPGNHDSTSHWFENIFALDTSESVQTRTGVNYSFDYGNVHFAVVNTNDLISVSEAQLTWLRNDMNSTSADWKIVLMHKSPYTLGKDGKWPDALYLQKSLAAVCDETNVDLVMSGHDHMYLRTKPLNDNKVVSQDAGTTYVLSGTAGTKRYEIRGFLLNNFVPQEVIDTCVIQKKGYGNYYNGTDFDSVDEANIGGCFNTVSVNGGNLVLNSYIVNDEDGTVKIIDTFEISKAQGENTATFSGENTTSSVQYAMTEISTLMHLARYAFLEWLPKFIKTLPEIIHTYRTTGTF